MIKKIITFQEGTPKKPGWYLVKLIPGHINGDQEFDIDYLKKQSPSDGGGFSWSNWYEHNISHYAELPTNFNEEVAFHDY